jgi:hypothetical protein
MAGYSSASASDSDHPLPLASTSTSHFPSSHSHHNPYASLSHSANHSAAEEQQGEDDDDDEDAWDEVDIPQAEAVLDNLSRAGADAEKAAKAVEGLEIVIQKAGEGKGKKGKG